MSLSLKIQRGRFRGRSIPMPAPVHGHSNFTPALVKKAVFDLADARLGDLSDVLFFDLCAGSGQMGLEAYSLEYREVHLCELDQGRFSEILKEIKKRSYTVHLHRKDFRKMVPTIENAERSVVYLDPPYSIWEKRNCPPILEFLEKLGSSLNGPDLSIREILVIIQGPDFCNIPETLPWPPSEERAYGKNCLTILHWKKAM